MIEPIGRRFGPFWALVRKDLRIFAGDRRAMIVSFAVPLALASVLSMVGGGGGAQSKVDVAVVNDDGGAVSRELVDALSGDAMLNVEQCEGADEARAMVRQGEVGVAVVIPPGFGESASRGLFGGGRKPVLTFLTDPTRGAEAGMVQGVLMQSAMRAVSRDAFSGTGNAFAIDEAEARVKNSTGMSPALRLTLGAMFREVRKVREQTAGESSGPGGGGGFEFSAPFEVKKEPVKAGSQLDTGVMAAHSFAGMAVQFTLFSSVEGAIGLLTERQKGLWRRVRSAPVSRWSILGAKAVSQSLLALAVLALLFTYGILVFHVKVLGSYAGFLLVAAAYTLTASAFGLLVAALGKTPQAARGLSVLAVLVMVLLGGSWMPMFLFPRWVQTLTLCLPTRWAVDGFEGATWRGLGFSTLALKALVLLGFAAVFAGLAAARFRWEED